MEAIVQGIKSEDIVEQTIQILIRFWKQVVGLKEEKNEIIVAIKGQGGRQMGRSQVRGPKAEVATKNQLLFFMTQEGNY